MADEGARAALQRLIEERREDYAGLSRLIGRNPSYIQQYIKRGSPKLLAERDRRLLARYFAVDEALLGGPARAGESESALVSVPRLDVGASAGPGALPEEEQARPHIAFDPVWLRRIAGASADRLSMIRVEGDSMLPTLADGDDILVDRGDDSGRLRDGVYVLRVEGVLVVKRLALNPAAGTVSIRSDNPSRPGWPECEPTAIDVVGRVIWAGRRIG